MQTAASGEVEADQNSNTLPKDGERFLPDMRGRIAAEHLLRYHWAAEFVDDRDVLDIACGEGYGSYLLATRARSVVGADLANTAVDHARSKYHRENLTYDIADVVALPYSDNSFDTITCFETIEHVDPVSAAVGELRRVLRPDGVLLISTPNTDIYTRKYLYCNKFHKKEMELQEFSTVLSQHFSSIRMAGQASSFGSVIRSLPDSRASDGPAITIFPNQTNQLGPEAIIQYFVAICSASDNEQLFNSALYCDPSDDSDIIAEIAAARAATEMQQLLSDERAPLIPSSSSHAEPSLRGSHEVRSPEVKYNELLSLHQDLQRKHDLLRGSRKIEQEQKNAETDALRFELERYIESTTLQFKQLHAEHRNLWKLNDGLRQAKVAAEIARDDIEARRIRDLDVMRSQAHALRDRLSHLQSYASALADRSRSPSTSGAFAEVDDPFPDPAPSRQGESPLSLARLVAAPRRIRATLAAHIVRARLRARLTR